MGRGGLVGLLAALYLAQGLPFGFFTQALPVLMRDAGYSLTAISAIGLLFAPWALKFAWAPYVDAYGTRQRWLLAMQLASAATAFLLALGDLDAAPALLFLGVAVINLLSATQDIATDGLAVTHLGPRDRGLGNGLQVGAYRAGMIVGGGAMLWFFGRAEWSGTFAAMGLLLLATTVPVLLMREGRDVEAITKRPERPERLATAWWRRLCQPGFVGFLGLLIAFKFGDSMGTTLVGPYLVDRGFSTDEIALLKGVIASATVLLGAAVGGWWAWRMGRRSAMIVGGIAQCIALFLLMLSAFGIGGAPIIVAAVISESVFGGVAMVALFTLMMDACDTEHAGSDYTLLACAVVTAQGGAALIGGLLGDVLGYGVLFSASLAVAVLGSAALVVGVDRGIGPDRLGAVWPGRRSPGIRTRRGTPAAARPS